MNWGKLDRTLRKAYRSTVGPIFKKIHIHFFFSKLRRYLFRQVMFRSAEVEKLAVTAGGLTGEFHVSTVREKEILNSQDKWEGQLLEDLRDEVRSSGVFYDIGAHIGVFSVLVGNIINDGQVIAFEPIPNNAERAQENMDLNDVQGEVFELALSDKNDIVTFSIQSSDYGAFGEFETVKGTPADQTITVETVRGDDIITEKALPQPTVVKIDVDGVEHAVIEGMKDALSREECRIVYVEVHESRISRYEADGIKSTNIDTLLQDLGFETERIERKEAYYIKGTKK